jgi:ABC-2 type transport system permease protein
MLIPIAAMVRKDVQLFLADRRAVIMTFLAPIAIASFFGSIFSGDTSGEPARIPVAIVDQDRSAVSGGILSAAQADRILTVTTPAVDEAREGVRRGTITVAVVIPAGFGEAAGRAFFAGRDRPELSMWYDPSHRAELGLVRGILTEHVMQAVSREMFSGQAGQKMVDDTLKDLDTSGMPPERAVLLRQLLMAVRGFNSAGPAAAGGAGGAGFSIPYTVREEGITSGTNVVYNGYAHSFAGMGIQFLLFAAIDLGIGILLERQRGLWKRLRSAPISRLALLGGKAASGTLISLTSLLVSFGFAIVVFGVRIQGSVAGFFAVAVTCALMASTFGLLIASIGKTPNATRGVAILSVLMMVMLGGAWVPTFVFPRWLQQVTIVVPARWAVDGLDAMTWRGLGFSEAVLPSLVLLGFAVLFGALALARFRWEEA